MAYIRIEREEEAVSVRNIDITAATVDIPLKELAIGTNSANNRYVHAPKMKKTLKKQEKIKVAEAKEFSNTGELFIAKRKYQEDEELKKTQE